MGIDVPGHLSPVGESGLGDNKVVNAQDEFATRMAGVDGRRVNESIMRAS